MGAQSRNVCLTALTAFAAGFVTALFVTPQSGPQARHKLVTFMHSQSRRVTDQLHAIEQQLISLEKQIHATGDQLGQKVAEATQRTIEHYVPSISEAEEWELDSAELARDLRRMPRQ